jgi:hypothetical protein
VAARFFTAFCTFSNELTSIWRTRSLETPNSAAKVRKRDRVLGEPTRFEDAPFAIVEYAERRGERLAAVVVLATRGERSLLAGSFINQASPAIRWNRCPRGSALSEASPPNHRFMSIMSCFVTPSRLAIVSICAIIF